MHSHCCGVYSGFRSAKVQVNNSVFVHNYPAVGLWSFGDFMVHQPNRKMFPHQLAQFTDAFPSSFACPVR